MGKAKLMDMITKSKAGKAAKEAALPDLFAPRILKTLKESRQGGVSSSQALQGVSIGGMRGPKGAAPIGSPEEAMQDMMTARGPAGKWKARDDLSTSMSDGGAGDAVKKQAEAEEAGNHFSRKIKSLKSDRDALIKMNDSGYDNPRLGPASRPPMEMPSVSSFNMPAKFPESVINDSRPNTTVASSMLAERMDY